MIWSSGHEEIDTIAIHQVNVPSEFCHRVNKCWRDGCMAIFTKEKSLEIASFVSLLSLFWPDDIMLASRARSLALTIASTGLQPLKLNWSMIFEKWPFAISLQSPFWHNFRCSYKGVLKLTVSINFDWVDFTEFLWRSDKFLDAQCIYSVIYKANVYHACYSIFDIINVSLFI